MHRYYIIDASICTECSRETQKCFKTQNSNIQPKSLNFSKFSFLGFWGFFYTLFFNWHFRRCIERGISMHRKVCFDASVSSKRCIGKKRCIAFPKNDASKKTMHRNILFDASKKKRCIDNQIIDFPKKKCIVCTKTMHRYT